MTTVNRIQSVSKKIEKKAMAISAMGLVNRVGSRFQISIPETGEPNVYREVWRDDKGKIRCNCSEFTKKVVTDSNFRCEHILAVKFALLTKNTEPATKIKPQTANTNNVVRLDSMRSPRKSKVYEKQLPSRVTTKNPTVNDLDWHEITELLDKNSADWSYKIAEVNQFGKLVTVVATITINGVKREGLGIGTAEFANGIKNAELEAFKSAAIKFSLIREASQLNVVESSEIAGFSENPMATCLSDLITRQQLTTLRSIERNFAIDVEKECRKYFYCATNEISARAADYLIEHLETLHNTNKVVSLRLAV
jgi:rhodanese-related sulfurtransferase